MLTTIAWSVRTGATGVCAVAFAMSTKMTVNAKTLRCIETCMVTPKRSAPIIAALRPPSKDRALETPDKSHLCHVLQVSSRPEHRSFLRCVVERSLHSAAATTHFRPYREQCCDLSTALRSGRNDSF